GSDAYGGGDEERRRGRQKCVSRRTHAAARSCRALITHHRNARLVNTTVVTTGGVTAARAVAAEICVDLRRGEFLDQSFERRIVPLDARDRRWTRELVYGMLRHRAGIDTILSERVRGGLARLALDGEVGRAGY